MYKKYIENYGLIKCEPKQVLNRIIETYIYSSVWFVWTTYVFVLYNDCFVTLEYVYVVMEDILTYANGY